MKPFLAIAKHLARTSAIVILWSACFPAFGQLAAQDATNIFNDFYNTFYVASSGGGEYIWQQGGSFSQNDEWENAEMIEMTIDRYIAAPNTTDSNAMTALLNGFDKAYGTDLTGDIYNDDIMWCVLAHARAYLALYSVTGTINSSMKNWANIASNNFSWVYNGGHSPGRVLPQYDGTFGGGMWWTTNHLGSPNYADITKNACINGPAALAGFYLSLIFPNAGFQTEAKNMINWETTYLVQSDGFLYDHYATNGAVGSDLSYNVGTYVGAAGFLGTGIPETVADYYTNNYCTHDILPNWGTGGGNNDGFNGIFLRWVGTYELLSKHTNWIGFFNNQAIAAWAVTNATGLSWDNWTTSTAASGLYSWDCCASVSALQWAQISQNATAPLAPLQEKITFTNTATNRLQLNWSYGTLQSSANLAGPYTTVTLTPPYSVPITSSRRYYRVLEN